MTSNFGSYSIIKLCIRMRRTYNQPRSKSMASRRSRTSWWGKISGLSVGSASSPLGSHVRRTVLSSFHHEWASSRSTEWTIHLRQTNRYILSNDIAHSTGLLSHLDLELAGLFFLLFYLSIYLFLRCNKVICRLFCLISNPSSVTWVTIKSMRTFFFADISFCTSFTFFRNAFVS